MYLQILIAVIFAFCFTQTARAADQGIAWIPTWKQALKEAKQTNKPIMLMAGAPACGGVPGIW